MSIRVDKGRSVSNHYMINMININTQERPQGGKEAKMVESKVR